MPLERTRHGSHRSIVWGSGNRPHRHGDGEFAYEPIYRPSAERCSVCSLEAVFDKWWPDLFEKVSMILGKEDAPAEPIRSERNILEEILMLTRSADTFSRGTSIDPGALVHIANSLIMVHNQQVHRQGSYQDALDLLKRIQLPLSYLLRQVSREGDGIVEVLFRLDSLEFTAVAESVGPDEFFYSDEPPDEDVPF